MLRVVISPFARQKGVEKWTKVGYFLTKTACCDVVHRRGDHPINYATSFKVSFHLTSDQNDQKLAINYATSFKVSFQGVTIRHGFTAARRLSGRVFTHAIIFNASQGKCERHLLVISL